MMREHTRVRLRLAAGLIIASVALADAAPARAQFLGRRWPVMSGLMEGAARAFRTMTPDLRRSARRLRSAPPGQVRPDGLFWYNDYAAAYARAKSENRMLLIYFVPKELISYQTALDRAIVAHPVWRQKLSHFVLARLPETASVAIGGSQQALLQHRAFGEMHGRPGIAVVDLAHAGQEYFGHVVSAFPFMQGKYYRWRADYLPTILDLPPGTITQRTMVWAVRVHPERPASALGNPDAQLAMEAFLHCQRQAQMGVQGHHHWESRFHMIRARMGGGTPVEVVAESWPGQNMIDSCVDCVASWRQSSGHWNAVRSPAARYGYDIRRGSNGIWYATGIFIR